MSDLLRGVVKVVVNILVVGLGAFAAAYGSGQSGKASLSLAVAAVTGGLVGLFQAKPGAPIA